ncbi:MAG TPA: M20/M25/M40 family metallo-hydrolase [Chitinophagaceae bacterium]|nr:M20/M25/M40 family metallo-hydrolase [Chitinophagaceae bacterium]
MRKLFCTFSALLSILFMSAQGDKDADIISKIKKEGIENSQVMYIAHHLTDVSGPRLTNSPGFFRAANWAKEEMTKWGLVNAHLEPWGEFGKGWQQEKCYVAMTAPYYQPLIAVPRAWTGSTRKFLQGEVMLIKAQDTTDMAQYAGKLKDKIVMTWSSTQLKPSFEPDANRYADSSLEKMAAAQIRQAASPNQPQQQGPRQNQFSRFAVLRRINEMINQEGPALVLSMNASGNDGTVFVSSGGQYTKNATEAPPSVMLSSDDYLRLQRLIEDGIKVQIEADIKTEFFDKDLQAYNVIAEIPGTDPKLKDEIVMLGGHLDSWHGATGATDNAAGCSVMMEVVRILKALNIQPRRTIRIALWSGEEEGLLGSRAYAKAHFADTANGQWVLKPEQSKVSAYYNLDNGSGKIRGVYLQGNEAERPIFAKWLEPFSDMGAKTITINNTGGTDHLSFDRVGIPGFQFIQDEIEYDTRTHHTNMDTYDHLVPDDLKQASVIIATFVYNTTQRDEKMPRKEMPPARPSQRAF